MPKPKEPCPKCGIAVAIEKDCGYSSFDPVWVECPCGFRLNGTADNWDRVIKALNAKGRIPMKTQRWADALARLMTVDQLEKILVNFGTSYR